MLTKDFKRINLAYLPTPIDELINFRKALHPSPRIIIKRDDQTGLATGGNKARKLEFVIAAAIARGADTLITAGGPQSNHCRQTAAAAAKLGLKSVLVLAGDPMPPDHFQGNLAIDNLCGAEIRWCREREPNEVMAEVSAKLKQTGLKPYVIEIGASVPLGALGFVAAVEELSNQLNLADIKPDRIIFASGSGGTQAGILAGVKALGLNIRVEAVHDGGNREELLEKIKLLTYDTERLLGLNLNLTDEDFILHGKYGTSGYGVITQNEKEAIRLLAETEGIITDPVYTGRALAGLIDLVRTGYFKPEETILFWHTGGVAGLFPRISEVL